MNLFSRAEPFEYINNIDTSKEWWQDFPWWFQRTRGIVATIVLQIMAPFVGLVLNWPHLASALVFCILGGIAAALYWLRQSRIRRMNADEAMHRLTHDLRTGVFNVTSAPSDAVRKTRLDHFFQELVDNIAAYFRERTGNQSFNCIIRKAAFDDNDQILYVTAARSKGLADERSSRTQGEKANEGIAKQFLHVKTQGAYLIHDRLEATRSGIWKMTDNDTLGDFASVLSVPVNGWYAGEFGMLGILHLTVGTGKLKRSDWLPLKAFSDLLGHILAIVYDTDEASARRDLSGLVDTLGNPLNTDEGTENE